MASLNASQEIWRKENTDIFHSEGLENIRCFWLMIFVCHIVVFLFWITLSSLTLLEEPDACLALGGIVSVWKLIRR